LALANESGNRGRHWSMIQSVSRLDAGRARSTSAVTSSSGLRTLNTRL